MSVKIKSISDEADQYKYIATYIKTLIGEKQINEEDIAVIARKHKFLDLMSIELSGLDIDVNYEKKDNILNNPNVVWLCSYLKLVYNLASGKHEDVDYLIPEILSHEFWQLHPFIIYDISLKAYQNKCYWLEIMKGYECNYFEHQEVNESVSEKIRNISEFFIYLANQSRTKPVEVILDYILGNKTYDPSQIMTMNNESDYIDSYESEQLF